MAAGIATAWTPHARAGSMRPLALLGDMRISDFPDLPTLKEVGFDYYMGGSTLLGIAAPKGLPDEILKKLEDAIRQAADSPEFKEGAKTVSHVLYFRNSKEFTQSVEIGVKKIGDMIKEMK